MRWCPVSVVFMRCRPKVFLSPCRARLSFKQVLVPLPIDMSTSHSRTHLSLLWNKGQGGEGERRQTVAGSTLEISTRETEKKRSRVWTQRREKEIRTPEELDAPVSFAPFLLVGHPIAKLVPELVQIRTAPIGKEGRIAFARQYRRRRGRANKARRLLSSSMSSQFSFAHRSR